MMYNPYRRNPYDPNVDKQVFVQERDPFAPVEEEQQPEEEGNEELTALATGQAASLDEAAEEDRKRQQEQKSEIMKIIGSIFGGG